MAANAKPEHPEDKGYPYVVNGTELVSAVPKLLALDILTAAKNAGAIPLKPEDYLLQSDQRKYKPHDYVNLEEDNSFITVPQSSTPVA